MESATKRIRAEIIKSCKTSVVWIKRKINKAVYHKDLQIPAKLFFDILDTQDYNLLIVSGYPTEQELFSAWDDIIDKYFQRKDDQHLLDILRLQFKIEKIKQKIENLKILTQILFYHPNKESDSFKQVLKQLYKIGARINPNKPIKDEILRIQTKTIGTLNETLELSQSQLAELTKEKKVSFHEALAALSSQYLIPENISLEMYLALEKTRSKNAK